jgi:K(+)-stimulated pyrophosphate-energized sodium pump
MRMAVQGNVRVAAARTSFKDALRIAYRAGTITGMLTDGLGLLGGTFIFMIFGKAAPDALLGFGFGGTLLALFMRVGGGIFTKAADVGADLVGKVEQDGPKMIRAMRPLSPTSWATTWATAPVWPPTSLSPTKSPLFRP